jgi:hypothetical protein
VGDPCQAGEPRETGEQHEASKPLKTCKARLASHTWWPARPGCKQTRQTSMSSGEPGQGSSQHRWVNHARLASDMRPASHSSPANKARLATHASRPAGPGCKQTRQRSRSSGEPGQSTQVSHTRRASSARELVHGLLFCIFGDRPAAFRPPAIRHLPTCPVATQAPSRLGFIHSGYNYTNHTSFPVTSTPIKHKLVLFLRNTF